jgi:hypothetical protein
VAFVGAATELAVETGADQTDVPSAPGGTWHDDPWKLASWIGLAAIVALGTYLRVQNLTSGGLERDDAWVSLSTHVRLTTALRMGATAPGFTLLERTWILLNPHSAVWAQILPLAMSIVAIVAGYALVRYFGLARGWALGGAFAIAVSPVALIEATHVKQYGTDIVLCCALLALGEATRRSMARRELIALAVASFVALGISASIVPVLVGVWAAVLVAAVLDRRALVRTLVVAGAAAVACGALLLVMDRHVSTTLDRYWRYHYGFLSTHGVHALLHSGWFTWRQLTSDFVRYHGPALTLAAWVLVVLVVVGMTRGMVALSSTITLVVAFTASAAGRIPLGTGRTDEVLFPVFIVLALLGLQQLAQLVGALLSHLGTAGRVASVALAVAACVALLVVGGQAVKVPVQRSDGYPATDIAAVTSKVEADRQPGDLLYVEALSRYPWALAHPNQVKLVLGNGWGAGFSAVSTDPHVFIAPSEWWENGYTPTTWVRDLSGRHRLWFIGTGSRAYSKYSHDWHALTAAGWHPVRWITGNGDYAALMER